MLRLQFYLLIAFTAVTLFSCTARTEPLKKNESTAIPVRVIPVKEYNALEKFPVSGQFTTDDEVMMSFKTTGIINKIFVKEGDIVAQGQIIGTIGSTGNSTGPHLHFEIRDFGRRANPLELLMH